MRKGMVIKMKAILKNAVVGLFFVMTVFLVSSMTVFAADNSEADNNTSAVETIETEDNSTGDRAMAAGIAIGLAALGGAIGMGLAIAKSAEGISRQPESEGKIRTNLMLGLVFVETAIIYALIIAILIIFVI